MVKAIVERNPSVDLLVTEALKHRGEDGWLFDYGAMRAAAGGQYEMQSPKGRGVIATWKRIMLNEHGMVFLSVKNTGYKLADDSGKVDAVGSKIRRVKRQVRSARSIHVVIDMTKVPDSKKHSMQVHGLQLAILLRDTGTRSVKKLEKVAATIKPADLKRLGLSR